MTGKENAQRMEKIVSLCKRRGFIFQSSEIYGGLNGVWDYGPLGTELKNNLKQYWWQVMVRERDDVVGLDGAILTHPAVLKASGHVDTFTDPMVDCRTCKARLRADQLAEKNGVRQCPNCGGKDLTEARPFNLMFQTQMGASADPASIAYLRPETAQSIFVQFKNVLDVSRKKLPFGIAQIGKAFRNEINPRNFTFRSREFEQMELEYFCRPEQGMDLLAYWLRKSESGFTRRSGFLANDCTFWMCRKKSEHFIPKARSTSNTSFPLGGRSWRGSRIAPITTCSSTSRPAASLSIISMRKPRNASCHTWSNQARESIARCWR